MIELETFARYATMRVPRYTSYPTAPNFGLATDDDAHRQWLGEVSSALVAARPYADGKFINFERKMRSAVVLPDD